MSEDPWAPLRKATSARIALGRTGGSLPTARRLEFQFAHAKARDAVLRDFDEEKFAARLASGSASGHEVLHAQSAARTRKEFLLRPDLGRRLSGPSRDKLAAHAALAKAGLQKETTPAFDLTIVLSDGLSTRASDLQIEPLLAALLPLIRASAWLLAPLVVVRHGRVAIQDEVGSLFNSHLALMLLGERPGLGSADSLGAYFTYAPAPGKHDADRNCVSNIHAAGTPPAAAAAKLHHLLSQSLTLRLSGISLKDDSSDTLPNPSTSPHLNAAA
jgi:ethanolamine ammonia-lyase small subunit